jgi:hypothetical protein
MRSSRPTDHDGVETCISHKVGEEGTQFGIGTHDGWEMAFAEKQGDTIFYHGAAESVADGGAPLADRDVFASRAALLMELVGQHVIDSASEHTAQHVERRDARGIVGVARDQRADRVKHRMTFEENCDGDARLLAKGVVARLRARPLSAQQRNVEAPGRGRHRNQRHERA